MNVKIKLLLIVHVTWLFNTILYRDDINVQVSDMYSNNRQAIYMRNLLSKLHKERGNFPLIFTRLHSR